MSKSSTKVFIAVLILGLLLAYYFLVLVPRRAASDFIIAYEEYKIANTSFTVPLYSNLNLGAENLGRETAVDLANNNMKLAINWNDDYDPLVQSRRAYRIQLAEKVIEDDNGIIKLISQNDKPQTDCEKAQLALNTAAASLKNSELRKCATEICDYVLKSHNSLVSYKQALLEKSKLISDMMNSIIEDNGKRGKLSSFLIQNRDKINKLNEVIDKANTDYEEETRKIETTYARFEGLAGIKEKTDNENKSQL